MKTIYVVYHKNCLDGYGAAWAAYKLFGDEAEYIPTNAGEGPPEIPDGVALYTVDIAYPPGIAQHLAAKCSRVVMIDHHQTAQTWYENSPVPEGVELVFDMSKSGAVLSWEFFHREKKVPELLRYIQDRDLWQWKIPDSEEVLLAVDSYPYTFETLDKLMGELPRLKTEGRAIVKYRNQMLELQLESAHFVEFTWREVDADEPTTIVVPGINCSLRALSSEVCHELLNRNPDAPFVVSYRRDGNGRWNYSLRSRGDFDVAVFATKYAKGGGHKAAAGMTTPNPPEVVDAP